MRLTGCEEQLLRSLTVMPFIDRLELAAISGWSRGAAYGGVRRLEDAGLAASVPHAADLTPPTRRYFPTAAGLERMAEMEDVTVSELLRIRPVSARWRSILLDRLDALAVVYRLAAVASDVAHPIGLRLYRAMPLDAAMTLPDGRTVGIIRQGLLADRTGFAKRVWRLGRHPLPGTLLVLVPDEVRLRHARRLLTTAPLPTFVALERDATLAGPGDEIWRPAKTGSALDLGYALSRVSQRGGLPAEVPPSRVAPPGPIDADVDHALPVALRPAEKRALDLIFDWPWILQKRLAASMNVSPRRAAQIVTPLEGFGLVARPIPTNGRLALTDRGLALLARRDRVSVAVARKRWSVAPIDPEDPYVWRNVSGGRSRQLLRNIEHTGAVHAFVAALATQAHILGWETVQLDPPHRASRHFRHEGSLRSVHPDAFGVLRRGPATWAFFLEWERRAVRPSTMSDRLAPYLRYYSSHRPTDDHGVRPAVLIVFDDDIAATNFLRVASEEMDATRVDLPLWVSHRGAMEKLGPLGRTWRVPGDWEPAQLLMSPPHRQARDFRDLHGARLNSGTGRERSGGSRPVQKGGSTKT